MFAGREAPVKRRYRSPYGGIYFPILFRRYLMETALFVFVYLVGVPFAAGVIGEKCGKGDWIFAAVIAAMCFNPSPGIILLRGPV